MDPRALLRLQGAYYTATGVWPLLSIGSFQAVTGPKTDEWLVKTVGVLVGVMGLSFLKAARRGEVTPETRLLAKGSAAALAAVDANYSLKGRISKIYLADALVEAALVRAWQRSGSAA